MAQKNKPGRKQNKQLTSWAKGPIRVLFYILAGALLLIFGRYAFLQTVDSAAMTSKLQNQVKEKKLVHVPRGTIYDCNMKELAVSTMSETLYIDAISLKNLNKDPDLIANQLSPLIGIPVEEIKAQIAKGGGYNVLKREMPYEMTKKVHKLIDENSDYSAFIGTEKESLRFYPNDMLAANIIGFVGADDTGLEGIEEQFDSLIKGDNQQRLIFNSGIVQQLLDAGKDYTPKNESKRKNIQLTINAQYQFIVEKALDKAMLANKPKSITAIVMNPKTGEILAMAMRPSFNPNKYYDYDPYNWRNRAITDIYEPGSVFKAFVAGAGFQEKLVSPTDTYVDPGVVSVPGANIHNWNDGSFGTVTFLDVVKNSINTGFAQLGLKLGGERLMGYAKRFGFGSPTGVDLPGEAQGILFDNPKEMAPSDIATSSIGQSIAVTPLQMITAMSAIANGGILMKPQIIKAIYNADDTIYKQYKPEQVRRVLDPDVNKTLIGVLEQVVATGGGSKAKIQGYHIAGKTGTAQKLDQEHGGYLPGTYIASFCGFGPVENPQFTVMVIIDTPTAGAYYGGVIAAPVAHDIFLQLFRYANIKPVNGNQSLMDGLSKDVIAVPVAKPAAEEKNEDEEE